MRAIVTSNSKKLSKSYTFTSRYMKSADDYLTLIAGIGISPDDRARNLQINERLNLRTARFSLGYQHTIWSRNITGILGTLVGEQYVAVKGRKSITFL